MIQKKRHNYLLTGTTIILLLLLIFCPFPAKGSEITEQLLTGTDILNDKQLEEVKNTVEMVPSRILDCFKENGGKISFRKEPILLNTEKVLGVYWIDDHSIEIWGNSESYENGSNSLTKVILHELGHFVYDISSDKLSDKTKDYLQKAYQYYSKYIKGCNNTNETFANIYAWYYGNMAEISENMKQIINEMENICSEE